MKPPADEGHAEQKLELHEDRVSVEKERQVSGRVLVHVTPQTHEERIAVPLSEEHADVRHVPIGRFVDAPPPVRQEGDEVIVPVLEEVLVVEKRLFLREEIRVVRQRSTRVEERSVEVRVEDVHITRTP